jgi:hypothetical protein
MLLPVIARGLSDGYEAVEVFPPVQDDAVNPLPAPAVDPP